MSMSQEEIEALMNGLDGPVDEPSTDAPATQDAPQEETSGMSSDDIEDLIAQTQDDKPSDNNDIDDLLAQIDGVSDDTTSNSNSQDNQENVDTSDIDDLLAGIEGVTDNTSSTPDIPDAPIADEKIKEDIAKQWADEKVQEGVFPLPAEPDTKVVGQLSEVASDSEEKASQIFDVLSFILDENNEIQNGVKSLSGFVDSQITLLATLTQKFPNIAIFKEHLKTAQDLKNIQSDIDSRIDSENMKVFEAMELMQFHDINRQKIERVMSVIRKLSTYLNNLFEDTGDHKEIAVAKHIHGDSTEDVVENDDLEALIAEFNN
jgi:hypothetical protein